jgi:hypothetical protein
MVALPTRYYVQRVQSHTTLDFPLLTQGWMTMIVTFDRAIAEQYREGFESAHLFEQGEDVSDRTVTIARVITAEELLTEGGEQALAEAEVATRIQLWQELEKWADPLIAPDSE